VEWVEASGKSLAEAKETVLDMLGVAEDDAEFVVLSEPKAGLFGRLRGEARVQARVRPVAPPPKRGRRQRPDKKREGGDRSRATGSSQKNGGGRGNADSAGDSGEGTDAGTGPTPVAAAPNGATDGSSGNRRSRSRGGQRNGGAKAARDDKQASGRSSGDSEDSMEESLTLEQQGEAAQEFLAGLVREFGLDANVGFTEVDEDTVQVSATGDDLGLLVGPRGATLAAVQDLTRTFVQRQSENRTDRILVDVGGYREKRNAALRRFAEGIVDEVKSSGTERALEPMSPADRKVIHDTVNEIDGVETRSDGMEPSRYVVIAPA
jgi:spoIIIJ-associated protein